MSQPLVSVIMPAFNAEKFIAEAIESAVNQTYKNVEVIVVDDGSTDRTAEIAKSYNIVQYVYQKHQGVAAARNRALQLQKGDFLVFLDADDIYHPEKIEKQLVFLTNNPEVDCCISGMRNFLEPESDLNSNLKNYFERREKIALISMMVRKSVVLKVGEFNTSYHTGSDFEWVTRVVEEKVKIQLIREELIERRIHDNNLSVLGQKEDKAVRFRMLKESLDRRRAKGASK